MIVGQVEGLQVLEELDLGDGTHEGIVHQANGAEMGHGNKRLDINVAHETHVLEAKAPNGVVDAEDPHPIWNVARAGWLGVDGGVPAAEGNNILEGIPELQQGIGIRGYVTGGHGCTYEEDKENEEELELELELDIIIANGRNNIGCCRSAHKQSGVRAH